MLRAEHLSVSYGPHRALEDVSIHVESGEICVILGANGAGKSTLLKAIAGLVPPQSGAHVTINDHDISSKKSNRIVEAGVALVPEGRGIFGDLTVAENLQLGAYGKQARVNSDERLKEILRLFPKLAERGKQIARTMSGGEQQMVAIGRALMSNPAILMLDEPSLGLSPLLSSELFKSLSAVRDTGVGILLVEQNAKQSLAIADRAYLLENGHITGEGRADAMLHDPAVQKAYLGGATETGTHKRFAERLPRPTAPVAPNPATETANQLAARATRIQRAHIEAERNRGMNGHVSHILDPHTQSGGPIIVSSQADEISKKAAEFADRATDILAAHIIAQRAGQTVKPPSDASTYLAKSVKHLKKQAKAEKKDKKKAEKIHKKSKKKKSKKSTK